jgi:hypothetical protein
MRNGRDRRSGKPVKCHARKERALLVGTRSANHIRAGGHSGCTQRPDTWLHPNASRKRQIPLASRAPSIHGTSRTSRDVRLESAKWAKADLVRSLSPIVICEYARQSVPLGLCDTARYFPDPRPTTQRRRTPLPRQHCNCTETCGKTRSSRLSLSRCFSSDRCVISLHHIGLQDVSRLRNRAE